SDLNGIRFCDMPWILDTDNGNRKLRRSIKKNFAVVPDSQINRLYALGVDAYNVIPALASLQSQSYERYDGETGTLMMDDSGRLHRQLSWAVFERGVPRLLPPAATTPE
ncbi:MAG TPA: penicillin-binding protein activator, partial [Gammaproteobacteria bacterium]|nr:penicillin-binding protein activator [Gammaproteobacteria bacterium]